MRLLLGLKRQTKPASQPFLERPWFESPPRESQPQLRYVDWRTCLERALISVSDGPLTLIYFVFVTPVKAHIRVWITTTFICPFLQVLTKLGYQKGVCTVER